MVIVPPEDTNARKEPNLAPTFAMIGAGRRKLLAKLGTIGPMTTIAEIDMLVSEIWRIMAETSGTKDK